MVRPSWDEYFMKITEITKTRSTCVRRQVGAIIVKNKQILSTGYNGAPARCEHCDKVGCLREQLNVPSGTRHELCRGLHAEQNALVHAAKHGINIDGAQIYVTNQPCIICTKLIINAGIKKVIYKGEYPDEMSLSLLNEAGVEVEKYSDIIEPKLIKKEAVN